MIVEKIKLATNIIGATVCFALFFIVTMIPSAMAETFSIEGMALNTNSRFPLKDGHPIMSTWQLNPNDNDQQFDRRSGNLLQHRSTGKCLNAFRPANGSIVNVYPCNANDGDQKFSLVSAGNNKMLIKKDGTSLCLDMPNRNANTRMILRDCNNGNANQQFVSNAGTTTNNPQPPTPAPTQRASQTKVTNFVNDFKGKMNIKRYDRSDLGGQCVTLVARYLQEHYGASRTVDLGLGNGGQTAGVVASKYPNSFSTLRDTSDPIPGAIMSFPNAPFSGDCGGGRLCGHVALVVTSSRSGNNLNLQILDSNGDGKALSGNSVVAIRNITIDTRNYSASGYGSRIQWVNPKD